MFILLHFISHNGTVLIATISPFPWMQSRDSLTFPGNSETPAVPPRSHHAHRFSAPNFKCTCCHLFLHNLLMHIQSVALPFQIWKSVSNASIQFYFHSKHSSSNHCLLLNSILQWGCNVSTYFHFFSSTTYSLDGKESNHWREMGG